jgi:beta-lactamase class A
VTALTFASVFPPAAFAGMQTHATARIAALERRVGGRLGVFARDTATGRTIGHRDSERFPMCSTFKLLVAGAVLARVDRGLERLDRRITYTTRDLLDYAPVTTQQVSAGGMTVAALCAAAIEVSDNTAANLLLRSIGGPTAVTRFARSIGDRRTRLDRIEPDVNTAIPGDPRDTTTPRAMAGAMGSLVVGAALSPASRARLRGWLHAAHTGDDRLRAGLPPSWSSGDKTGSGDHGTTNDVAISWPPGRAPIIIAAYFTGSSRARDERGAVLADVARIVAGADGESVAAARRIWARGAQ